MTNSPREVAGEREALDPCPFCGKSVQVVVTPDDLFNEDDDDYVSPHSPSFAVLCDAHKPDGPGGCGASGGFMPTVDEAIVAWNHRASTAAKADAGEDARDAARYRWLRERNSVLDDSGIFTATRVTRPDGAFDHNDLIALEEMDAAIDAAIAASPKTNGGMGS